MITNYLGHSPRIKVLQFLIENKGKSFSTREILLGANVKHKNLVETLKDLLDKDMVYIERKVGKSRLFQISEDHEQIRQLIEMNEIKEGKK